MIKKLDQQTILKLAAGEIIDRPVAIVKELIENAIDANASEIAIELKQGGIAEIKIIDNGMGISSNDIANAIEPHATSKLVDFDDLESVLTMGFRGEALASIAAVSEIEIHTWDTVDDMGILLTKLPGGDPELGHKAREQGTTITVSHLFKKIPVRFRFLKSPASEATLITRLVQQFSLHYPDRVFYLKNNGQDVLKTHQSTTLKERFKQLLSLTDDQVLPFQKQTNDILISGIITTPNQTFKSRTKCWFSVNGRMVKSPLFFKAIDAALRDAIPKGSFPALVCQIECPSKDVDINIHPKKEDVKFTNSDEVFIAIRRAVLSALAGPATTWRDAFDHQQTIGKQLLSTHLAEIASAESAFEESSKPIIQPTQRDAMNSSKPIIDATDQIPIIPVQANALPQENTTPMTRPVQPPVFPTCEVPKKITKWISLNKKYIIVPLNDNLLIFDQHAVHERILYDKFKQEFESQSIVSMPLLIPEYIPLTNQNRDALTELIPEFKKLGIDIDVFDDQQLIIREVPQLFSAISFAQWLGDGFNDESIGEVKAISDGNKTQALQMKACKAAVKSGQLLKDAEIESLIEQIMNSDQQFTCPHGRPLYIKMNESQLDALFLRS